MTVGYMQLVIEGCFIVVVVVVVVVTLREMKEMADVVQHRNLLTKVEKAFPELNQERCLEIYENVIKCVGNKRYVSYCRPKSLHREIQS